MELEIDLDKLIEKQMPPSLYCYLLAKYRGWSYPFPISEQELLWAEEKGYIKGYKATKDLNQIAIRAEFTKLAKIDKRADEINSWIREWCDLFPENLRNGAGMPIKSDIQVCANKMLWFFKEYKDYTKDDIFEVTKMYLMERKKKNYEYLITSDYFIVNKNNKTSPMANLLADVNTRDKWRKNQEGGGSAFHTQI